eukprot:1142379-Ditylum_brightwellii.AAC.1
MQKALKCAQKKEQELLYDTENKKSESNKKIANIHALTGNITKEKALKMVINAEAMSAMWNMIRFTDKGMEKKHIDSLHAPAS